MKEKKTNKRQNIRKAIVFAAFLLFPVVINYMSPVLILTGAYEGIITGSAILFGLLFLSSLFLGRAWCSWLCSAGGFHEACTAVTGRKAKTSWGNVVRIIIWLAWMGMMITLFVRAGQVNAIDPQYMTEKGISFLGSGMIMFIYLGVVLLAFIMLLIWGNRAFCKYLCWMAPFMIIGNKIRYALKIPGLYLRPKKENCIECRRCNQACPMDIDVQSMVQNEDFNNNECIMCMQCVDICPKAAIITKR
ncbi:MAG: 4Fe-4S binding protein [Eubacteriales bacterium]